MRFKFVRMNTIKTKNLFISRFAVLRSRESSDVKFKEHMRNKKNLKISQNDQASAY